MLTLGKASALFGLIACGAAILYFTFQLYFDWMDHHSHMSPIKTALWTVLHLPYHIAIVLTVEGSGQWITARRTFEAISEALASFWAGFSKGLNSGLGGEGVANELGVALQKTYETYTFSVKTVNIMNEELARLLEFPDSYWKSFDLDRALNDPVGNDTSVAKIIGTLEGSLANGIFNTYGLTTSSKVKTQAEAEGENDKYTGEEIAFAAVIERLIMIVSSDPVPSSPALVSILDRTKHPCRN